MSKNKKKKLKKKAKRQAELLEKQILQLEELKELSNTSTTEKRAGDLDTEVDGDDEAATGEDADCDIESEGPSNGGSEEVKITVPTFTILSRIPSPSYSLSVELTAGQPSLEQPTTSKTGSVSASVVDTKIQHQDSVGDVSPLLNGDKRVKPKSCEYYVFNSALISAIDLDISHVSFHWGGGELLKIACY